MCVRALGCVYAQTILSLGEVPDDTVTYMLFGRDCEYAKPLGHPETAFWDGI